MFPVKHSILIDPTTALIAGEPRILLFDVVPILYTGKNKYGTYVVGKSVDEDEQKGIERYFHLVLTNADYRRFNAGFVSYLDLLKEAERIFVIDKKTRSRRGKPKVGIVKFSDIPKEYLPTEYSFFPKALHEPSIRGLHPDKYRAQMVNICSGIADELIDTKEGVLRADLEQGNDEDTNTIRGQLLTILYKLKEKNKQCQAMFSLDE